MARTTRVRPYRRKKGTVSVRGHSRQTGSSNTRLDKLRSAKPPGKRKSKKGKTYYEYRRNRSDLNRKTKL